MEKVNNVINSSEMVNNQIILRTVINSLVTEGFLKQDDAEYFKSRYAIITTHKSWFHTIFDKLFLYRKDGKDDFYYDVVKFISDHKEQNIIELITDLEILK